MTLNFRNLLITEDQSIRTALEKINRSGLKNIIVVTGGAGFVGSNLIELFLKKTKFKIMSLDNYSSGFKINHHKSSRVKYIKGDTKDIFEIFKELEIKDEKEIQ